MQGLFITSNNTDSGKTFISCQIIDALNELLTIEVRKPIETNCKLKHGILIAKDAMLLQKHCKIKESIDTICPYKFELFASSELASAHHNITLDNLVSSCQSDNFVIVEGVGGFYSPLIKNTLNSNLAKALNLPIIIVIEDKIGAISEALLTIKAVKNEKLNILAIILNKKQENNLDNTRQLQKYTKEVIINFHYSNLINFYQKIQNIIVSNNV